MYDLEEDIELDKNKKHSIEVVIDRIVIKEGAAPRLADSLESALKLGEGRVLIDVMDQEELLFSEHHSCPICGFSIDSLEPRMFSFNNPFGACPECDGLGAKKVVDVNLVIPDKTLTLRENAIVPWEGKMSKYYPQLLECVCAHYGIDMDIPVKDVPEHHMDKILHGSDGEKILFHYENDYGQVRENLVEFEGVLRNIERRYRDSSSDMIRDQMEKYMAERACKTCKGYRLSKQSLAVKVEGRHIGEVSELSIEKALAFFNNVTLSEKEAQIAKLILREIDQRLLFLTNVGLDYITLSRSAGTLSGGEAQRIRLATQIGSRLTGVLYILDEPSIGLHQRDNELLIGSLKNMRDIGNTLIVVEHDEDTMMAADYLIDVGPGAGVHGGQIMAAGTPEEVMANPNSLTGQYLSGEKFIPLPIERRKAGWSFYRC